MAIAKEFVTEAAGRLGLAVPAFSNRATGWMASYSWPGNIRELRSVVERAVLLARGGTIEVEHLQVDAEFSMGALRSTSGAVDATPIREAVLSEPVAANSRLVPAHKGEPESLRDEVERLERERIADAIARCGGNQTKAAEVLGMSRRALLNRLDIYGLPRPRKGT